MRPNITSSTLLPLYAAVPDTEARLIWTLKTRGSEPNFTLLRSLEEPMSQWSTVQDLRSSEFHLNSFFRQSQHLRMMMFRIILTVVRQGARVRTTRPDACMLRS